MSYQQVTAFVLASVIIAVTPGPGVLFIVTRSITQGRAAGLSSVVGVAVGNYCNATVAALGMAAVLDASPWAYRALRLGGAIYLCYLALQAWRSEAPATAGVPNRDSHWKIALQAFVVAALNPKTAIFFAAFLPQFIDPAHGATAQLLALAAGCVVIAAVSDSAYAVLADLAKPYISGNASTWLRRYVAPTVYVALAVFAAVGEH